MFQVIVVGPWKKYALINMINTDKYGAIYKCVLKLNKVFLPTYMIATLHTNHYQQTGMLFIK